jgi:hypothetical protein
MMFGSVLVSMIGIALPIVAGVWIMPRGERVSVADSQQRIRGEWLLLRQCRRYHGWMSAAIRQWPVLGSIGPSSTIRHG